LYITCLDQLAVRILSNSRPQNSTEINRILSIETVNENGTKSGEESLDAPVSKSGELWTLIEGLLATVISSVGAGGGIVRVLSPDSQMLHIAGAIGLPSEVCEDESIVDINCGVCGKAACDKNIHLSETSVCAQRQSRHFTNAGCKFVVASPVEYKDKLIGVFTLFFASSEQVPKDILHSLRPFSRLIGTALESARMRMGSHRTELMAERQAMANEIHDSLAHTLYYARMRMSLLQEAMRTNNEQLALKCVEDVDEALKNSQKSAREIITHFRCQMDPMGLEYALQALVERFRKYTGITVAYANFIPGLALSIEHELQVYYIVRESMANVAAHSSATQVNLTIEIVDGNYHFIVVDNGAGFDGIPGEGHYGLMIMRERALRIGGEVNIQSSKGKGTRVELKFSASGIRTGGL